MSKFEDNDLPRLHIMQQLQRAKLSLFGGIDVGFRDGTTRFVSGREAELFLSTYAPMRPYEKEQFQKKICQSRSDFEEYLQELNKYNNNQTEILRNVTVGKNRQRQ